MRAVFGATHGQQIAFVGPFGVGKSTAVEAVTQSPMLRTEAVSTVAAVPGGRHRKPTSTVGLEYGEWTAPDGSRVAVVGTPGQARFDVVRRSAMPRSAAVVLWLFGHHREALLDCELWVDFVLGEGLSVAKLVVAVTRLPESGPTTLADFAEVAERHAGEPVPVLAADPRAAVDVRRVLLVGLGRCGHPSSRAEA